MADTPQTDKPLYDRLGGIYAITLVVDRFSDKVVDNPMTGKGSKNEALNDWSTNHLDRLPGLKYMRSLWVADVSGGPMDYTGKNLGEAHARFNIKPEEFDEVAAELRRSLEHYGVPDREKEEALAAFMAHKGEVTAGSKNVTKE